MSTTAQHLANIENSALSTGPRTEEGKAISSRNAIKHGLTSKSPLLSSEDAAAYRAHCDAFAADLKPGTDMERKMVRELAGIQWRLERVPCIEAAILDADEPDLQALNNINSYAGRLKRQFKTTQECFAALRNNRIANKERQLENASLLRRADRMANRPTNDLEKLGFDFSVEELDRKIYFDNRFYEASDIFRDAKSSGVRRAA